MTARDEELRAWAKGIYPTEAATELLIRFADGRFASAGRPWTNNSSHGAWIDFDLIGDNCGAYSGGEQRVLMIIASIGGGEPVDMNWALSGLDRQSLDLVLSAVAHAAGGNQYPDAFMHPDGSAKNN
jgi:hypothetical protein